MKEFEQEEEDLIESGLGKSYILTDEEIEMFERLEEKFKQLIQPEAVLAKKP